MSQAMSTDLRRIAAGSAETTVMVWDAERGEYEDSLLVCHSGFVNCVAVSANGRRVASGAVDSTVRIWNTETGEVISSPLTEHDHMVTHVALNANGSRVVSRTYTRVIYVWDVEAAECVLQDRECIWEDACERYLGDDVDDKEVQCMSDVKVDTNRDAIIQEGAGDRNILGTIESITAYAVSECGSIDAIGTNFGSVFIFRVVR